MNDKSQTIKIYSFQENKSIEFGCDQTTSIHDIASSSKISPNIGIFLTNKKGRKSTKERKNKNKSKDNEIEIEIEKELTIEQPLRNKLRKMRVLSDYTQKNKGSDSEFSQEENEIEKGKDHKKEMKKKKNNYSSTTRSRSEFEEINNLDYGSSIEIESKSLQLHLHQENTLNKISSKQSNQFSMSSKYDSHNSLNQIEVNTNLMFSLFKNSFCPSNDFKGIFLDSSKKILKYRDCDLEFRELPKKQAEIEIISNLPKFNSNVKVFSTQTTLDEIFDYYQSKDSIINREEFGIAFSNQDHFQKGIFKIIPNNELTKKEIQKMFLENSLSFGVWAKINKKYCLGGYISKLGNKYDTIQFGRKPSFVTIILPDKRKIEILIDLNCKVELIIKNLVKKFSLKRKLIKNEILHEIKYHLFLIEFAKENGKLIESQLVKINPYQSLDFQGIYQFSKLKMVSVTVPSLEKNTIKNVSSKTNLWKELRTNQQNLTLWKEKINERSTSQISQKSDFLFNRICGISLNKLIVLLTSTGYQTEEFLTIFLELLPSYSNELTVLNRLVERFDVPSLHPQTRRTILEDEKLDIQILVLNLIVKLIGNNPNFFPLQAKHKLKKFIQSDLINNFNDDIEDNKDDNSNSKVNSKKYKTISKHIKAINDYLQSNSISYNKSKNMHNFRKPTLKIKRRNSVRKLSQINLESIDFEKVDLDQFAQQISLSTHNIFSKITSRELFNKEWTRRDKHIKAPNLTTLINKFNFYADWASTIILEKKNSKKRLGIFQRLILLAHEFFILNNFQDMFAILSGLQSAPVSRLFNLKKDLPKKCLKIYNNLLDLTDVTSGCKKLRKYTLECSLPAIPYIGTITSDLAHIHELPNFVDNNLLNWRKRMRIYEVIAHLRKFKQIGYSFIYLSNIQNYLDRKEILDEDSMWDVSFEIKPHPMNL
ncbi:guanine nucleotide exchange factor [Anaeramoeba flamelloides]|uniref:Guanine nucleotide exchange factor n=1 Tax=Anaeramoeba flamelloides TaxID=1746091 RepID=A0ABQ8XWB1_9EUKA|nr:guanine nucleotide exchange factor [Anaeramoeba flamelloides]